MQNIYACLLRKLRDSKSNNASIIQIRILVAYESRRKNFNSSIFLTNLGMLMPTGQPLMQVGFAQSRHLWASIMAISGLKPVFTSILLLFLTHHLHIMNLVVNQVGTMILLMAQIKDLKLTLTLFFLLALALMIRQVQFVSFLLLINYCQVVIKV